MSRMSAATSVFLLVLALESAWAGRPVKGGFPNPFFPTCKVKTGVLFRDCFFAVPPTATGCTVQFGDGLPAINCLAATGITFGSSFTVQIPDTPGAPSCMIKPGTDGQAPTVDCGIPLPQIPDVAVPPSVGIPPVPAVPGVAPVSPILVGRTVFPPAGTGLCLVTSLAAGETPVVSCSPPTGGQAIFASGVSISLPTGNFVRCTFSVGSGGQIIDACVPPPLPLPVSGGAIVGGNVFTPPPGSVSCTLTLNGAVVEGTCVAATPGQPTFPVGTTLDLQSGSSSCTFTAVSGAPFAAQCVGIPVTGSPPVVPSPVGVPDVFKKKKLHG